MEETPDEYARRRILETGRPYLMTAMGHVFMDCAHNRRLAKECGGMDRIFRPSRKRRRRAKLHAEMYGA